MEFTQADCDSAYELYCGSVKSAFGFDFEGGDWFPPTIEGLSICMTFGYPYPSWEYALENHFGDGTKTSTRYRYSLKTDCFHFVR